MRAHMTRRRRGRGRRSRSAHRSRKIQSRRRTWRQKSRRARQQRSHRRQRGGMYSSVVGRDGIPHSEHAPTVVIKTIDGVPTAMSADTYERDYKATGEDVGQI